MPKSAAKPKEPSATADRIDELRALIARFEDLEADARDANQMSAAVSAAGRAADARRQLASILAEQEVAKERDPVRKIEMLHARAAQDGSWVAAARLSEQVDEARRKQDAERQAAAEAARRDPVATRAAAVVAFKRQPESMQELLLGELIGAASPGVRARAIAPFVLGQRVEARRVKA